MCAEAATEFAISLIQALVINNSKVISELHHLVDALAKVCCIHYASNIFLYIYILTTYNCSLLQGLDLQSRYNSWLRLPGILLRMLLLYLVLLLEKMITQDNVETKRLPKVSLFSLARGYNKPRILTF